MESEEAFYAYSSLRVRGAILDFLRKQSRLTRGMRIRLRQINEIQSKLEASLGRAPSSEEMANALDLSLEALQGFLTRALVKDDVEFDDEINHPHPSIDMESFLTWGRALDLIYQLPERYKDLMVRHYLNDQTIFEISQIYGVTPTVTNRTHLEALSLLRSRLFNDLSIKVPNYPRNHKVLSGRKRSVNGLNNQVEQAGVNCFDLAQSSGSIQHFEANG